MLPNFLVFSEGDLVWNLCFKNLNTNPLPKAVENIKIKKGEGEGEGEERYWILKCCTDDLLSAPRRPAGLFHWSLHPIEAGKGGTKRKTSVGRRFFCLSNSLSYRHHHGSSTEVYRYFLPCQGFSFPFFFLPIFYLGADRKSIPNGVLDRHVK